MPVSIGDTLYFVVGPHDDYNCDQTGPDISIDTAPTAVTVTSLTARRTPGAVEKRRHRPPRVR